MKVWNMPDEIVAALHIRKIHFYTGEHAAYASLLFLAQQLLRQRESVMVRCNRCRNPCGIYWAWIPKIAESVISELLAMSEEMQALASNLQNA